jgi:hypothetical protein
MNATQTSPADKKPCPCCTKNPNKVLTVERDGYDIHLADRFEDHSLTWRGSGTTKRLRELDHDPLVRLVIDGQRAAEDQHKLMLSVLDAADDLWTAIADATNGCAEDPFEENADDLRRACEVLNEVREQFPRQYGQAA